jgi:molybdenum cofactor synthesis domain-containing protein
VRIAGGLTVPVESGYGPEDVSTAGIVVIGNEVLSAKVEEKNARFLISELRALGVTLMRVAIIRDDVDTIATDVRDMASQYTHVFTSGGVGSTHDDVTLNAVARAFDVPIEQNDTIFGMLESHFGERMNDAVRRMAMLPKGAELLGVGELRFPLVKMRNVYVFPGVPSFLQSKFAYLRPRLAGRPFVLKQLFLSVSEDRFAEVLAEIDAAFEDVEFGSYPQFDAEDYRAKVTVEGRDADRVAEGYAAFKERIDPGWIVSER